MFYYARRRRRVYILYGRMTTIIIRRDRGRYAGRVDDKTKITIEKRFNKILTVRFDYGPKQNNLLCFMYGI